MVSSSSFLSEFKTDRVDPEAAPRLMVGAASPLWLMFGGAAAAGATWWWWASRWREAVNLEALSAPVVEPPSPEPLTLAAVETVEIVETAFEAVAEPLAVVTETVQDAVVEALDVANDVAVDAVAETLEVAEAVAETLEPVAVETVEAVELVAVAAAVDEVVEAPLALAEAVTDDLTRVVGIGPKLAASLAELGVTSFSQMAAWTPEELKSIDELLNLKGRAERDAWIAQAKRFAGAPEA